MKLLPVHCCCNPDIRLGFIEVRDDWCKPGPLYLTSRPEWVGGNQIRQFTIHTTIAELLARLDIILAVKSAHVPLERWRRVVGFHEEAREVRPGVYELL